MRDELFSLGLCTRVTDDIICLALPEEKIVQSPAVKSYGSLLFPLVFLLQLLFLWESHKYECAEDDVHFSGVLLSLDVASGKTVGIERIFYPQFDRGEIIK